MPTSPGRGRRATAATLATVLLAALLAPGEAGAAPGEAGGIAAAGPADGTPRTLIDFEGEVPFGYPVGIHSWGADADDQPVLTAPALPRDGGPDGNHVLHVAYGADDGGWGGFNHHLAYDTDPQDWSGYFGFRFWYYGTNPAPLPAGTGPRIRVEIKDGGAHAEASELWDTTFTDDHAGWTLIELPFSQFVYRRDWQPIGGINQVLDLTRMWGYGFAPPSGVEGTFALDDVQVYGVAVPPPPATVDTVAPVYPVDEGAAATVGIVLRTRGGAPLEVPVTVRYATSGGTATPGADYRAVAGAVTFPAGTATGAVREVRIATTRDRAAEVAETIDLTLASDEAALAEGLPATVVINAHGLPYLDPRLPVERRVKDLLGRMTLADKVGQMTQAERGALQTPDDIATWRLGSLLSGGGSAPRENTPQGWADMIDGFQLRARQTPLQIPLIYGVDAVHGHNNVVGATIFPHNIGLGAARDPKLAQRVGEVTAREVRATGVVWNFSPCLCVARDERWGRTYESFGEDPALVAGMSTIVRGLQGRRLDSRDSVLATAKHWVGDGGTEYGSSTTSGYTIDQGVTRLSEAELWRDHIAPYLPALRDGLGSVMPSFSSVDSGDGRPLKMHAHRHLITDVLKGRLGFDGFVVSDWQAIDQIPGDYRSDIVTSINAGLDMIMVPYEYQRFGTLLREEATAGTVPAARIDDAVRRILRKKFALGLFEQPYADRTHLGTVGSAAHRAVARDAATKSQVLLKNAGNLLPLRRDAKVYVAGGSADDIGNASGGWTITWQGSSGDITPGTTILEGIRAVDPDATYSRDGSAPTTGHDVGVVVVGETPYAEGVGDVGNGRPDLSLSAADQAAIDRVCAALRCVVLVVSGRPLLLDPARFAGVEAVVASWLPGTEGDGVVRPLYGAAPYTGRLPITWPRDMAQLPINVGDADYDPLYPYGWGLRTDPVRPRLVAARDALAATARAARPGAAGGWSEAERAVERSGSTGSDADRARLTRAVAALDTALARHAWHGSGAVRDERAVLAALGQAADLLEGSRLAAPTDVDAVVSVARDLVQARLASEPARPGAAAAVTLTATAEHELAAGRPGRAVRQLTRAWSLLR